MSDAQDAARAKVHAELLPFLETLRLCIDTDADPAFLRAVIEWKQELLANAKIALGEWE